jgi:protease I
MDGIMLDEKLAGKKVGILAKDGFEQRELTECKKALLEMGAEVDIISLEPGSIMSWDKAHWGMEVKVDKTLEDARSRDYGALIIPGGHFNPGALLHDEQALNFVKGFFDSRQPKPVAAIREGTLMLVAAGVVSGRIVTAYANAKSQLHCSNAKLLDEDIVIDNGLLTSRRSDKLHMINQRFIEEIRHTQTHC